MDTRKKNEGKAHRTDSLTIDASELKFQDLISQVPVPITIFQGPSYIVTTINKTALGIWGKSYEQVLNKALFEVSPELEDGLKKILNDIYAAGKPYTTNEIEVQLKRNGKPDSAYFNTVYQPLRDLDHKIYGIIVIGTEVTDVVNARKQIEESEKRFSNILSQSVMSIGILKGTDMVVTFANEPLLATWGKGKDVIGKTLLQVLPEITGLGFIELLQQVYNTGVPYYGYEIKVTLIRNGKTEELYHNFVYQPYRDVDDSITGVTILATEVTEKVLIKKQIEENDEEIKRIASHLKLATDSAKVGIWSLDIVSSKLEWSNIHKTMWGYDAHREDLTYEDWHKVILPADKEVAFQKIEESKVTHSIYEVEYRIKRANDGAIIWIKSTGQYHYDEFSIAHTLTGISIDITEQKQALQYARSLIEASLDPLVTISPEGKITDVNEASAKVTGETREKLIGTDFSDYFTEPEKARDGYKEVFEKGFVSDYPLTIHHKNGTLTDVMYNASVYKDDKANVLGVFAAARDVTAQKQASQYARSLLESSLDPLVTISPEGKITDVNEASVKVTGETREKLIGTDFSDYFTEPEKAREGYKLVFEKGFVSDYPLTIHHKNGTLTDVLYNASVYKDDNGNVLGVFAAARDVTAQKRITEELKDAKALAENALQSKQQFLSNMSHEIRTPMNAILGFTKVLLKADLGPKQKEYLDAIKTSSDGLLILINDILDLAKVDAGKMTFVQLPFKMDFSISTMHQVFDLKIKEKKLELVKEYDNKIPLVLIGDSMRLHQILLNILSNAIKFTSKGKITVAVRLLHEDEQNATIEFTITDTGIGIPEDKLESIFENFQQATSSSSFGGTGLGLAISKQLVEKQGGTIVVKSKVNEGSIFSFTLVFQKTNTKFEIVKSEEVLNNEINIIKVLIVEDVKLNQLLMKIILDDFNFNYDIADNGKIAIEKLQTETYDIILMDLQMPEMNGFEATEYIRKTLKSKIPIIALTADVTTVDVEKCKAAGMNDYVSKPLDEQILYTKMIELLKQ